MMPDIAAMMTAMIEVTMAIPAAHLAEPEVEAVVHFLGNARAFQERGHEDEERDRDQDVFCQ